MSFLQFDDRFNNKHSKKKNLKGVSNTLLNTLFFSEKNMSIIQNHIRYNVYQQSCNKYIISPQSDTQLEIIMRSIYLQYSKNLDTAIKQQIIDLNKRVISCAVPKILSNIKQYLHYRDNLDKGPEYMDHPKNVSNAGTKSLVSKIF